MSSQSTKSSKPYNEAGTDAKSVAINIASTLLILLPLACYIQQERCHIFVSAVVISFIVAAVLPPVGWKRPHPYSDMPENRPKSS